VGRADWRPSVTVDPMVIECPENCRNGIAGGKTSDLQVHKLAADRTTATRLGHVSNWRQIRSLVDAYSAARRSLRCLVRCFEVLSSCFVMIVAMHPI
jgi:hypothetical protein